MLGTCKIYASLMKKVGTALATSDCSTYDISLGSRLQANDLFLLHPDPTFVPQNFPSPSALSSTELVGVLGQTGELGSWRMQRHRHREREQQLVEQAQVELDPSIRERLSI